MQKISIISMLMLLAMALGACSGSDSPSEISGTDKGLPDSTSTDGKTLVVYFSKTLPPVFLFCATQDRFCGQLDTALSRRVIL